MEEMVGYRVRFRFRVPKKLSIAETEHRFTVAGREVVLASDTNGIAISESDWLVMNVRGFASEQEAMAFARKLRAAMELSSVACRFGIYAGVDLPTAVMGAGLREHVEKETGATLRDSIHGVDVFLDKPNVRLLRVSADLTVFISPDPFLTDLEALHPVAEEASQGVRDIALLLNYALMRTEPVAQIVFAVSAVEMLGQDEDWSDDQKRLLSELARMAEKSGIGTPEERSEVATAISKSVHRMTLGQGARGLLDHLGLGHLRKAWDDLCRERSTLVHGLAPKPGANYSDLATRTMNLCGQILLRAIANEMELAGKRVDT